jgi:pantetheine-phosphate adenylyltransferase
MTTTSRSKALFPGSFDPFTVGHRNLVDKFLKVFTDWDLVLGVGVSQTKKPFLSFESRKKSIEAELKQYGGRVSVQIIENLTVDTAKSLGIKCLLRGLRNAGDFEYEKQIHHGNKFIYPQVETIFLIPDANCAFISSSLVREIHEHKGNIHGLVSASVLQEIKQL